MRAYLKLLFSFLTLLLGTAALLLSLSMPANAAGNAIVIGQAIDLSGPNGSIGRDYVAGIKTFFDGINESGGINGRRINYIVRDDHGQPESSADLARELIERDQVDYLFGGVGDAGTQAILDTAAFKRSRHILFAPLAAGDDYGSRVLYWRPSYKQELRYIFSHFTRLGIKDIGVVWQDTPSNRKAYSGLSAEIAHLGMKLTGTARIGPNGEQTVVEATRIAGTKPGCVIIIADTISTGLFLKEFRKHAPQTFVAGTSLITLPTLQEIAGAKSVAWTVFSQVVPNPAVGTSLIQLEHANLMKKYRDETVSSLTLEGFAAAKTLIKAIQQSKRAGLALQDLIDRAGSIDLGGLPVTASTGNRHLSGYLDMALFKQGNGLMY